MGILKIFFKMFFAKTAVTGAAVNMFGGEEVDTDLSAALFKFDEMETEAEVEMLNTEEAEVEMFTTGGPHWYKGFPRQFWTATTAHGKKAGYGLMHGVDHVVLKSSHGKWV